jgi:hypothetical protein
MVVVVGDREQIAEPLGSQSVNPSVASVGGVDRSGAEHPGGRRTLANGLRIVL